MPRQRNFEKIYESLNVHREQESPRIPESERPSNKCEPADHSLCDFLFQDYKDGKGRLMWKGHIYRLDDQQLKQFRNSILKDRGGENENY